MKKLILTLSIFLCAALFCFNFVACKNGKNSEHSGEAVELAETTIGEISFENSESTKISSEGKEYIISGKIDKMSDAQKNAFGVEDVSHVVCIKFVFDREKTLDSFEIVGAIKKVYSTDQSVENYAGSLSELLDNNDGEDAYCLLVLSAGTKKYDLVCNYSDRSRSVISLKIEAALVSAEEE